MSRLMWIVNRTGWDYDDSHYYRNDNLMPYKAFTDLEIAKAFLKEREAAEIRNCASRFFSDFAIKENYDISNSDTLEDFCKELCLSDTGYEMEFDKPVEKYSDDELLKIAEAFHVSFFQIVEVELVA